MPLDGEQELRATKKQPCDFQCSLDRTMALAILYYMCPICGDELKEPVTTACGHSFCRYCLDTALYEHRQGVFKREPFPCPVCKSSYMQTPVLEVNIALRDMIALLKKIEAVVKTSPNDWKYKESHDDAAHRPLHQPRFFNIFVNLFDEAHRKLDRDFEERCARDPMMNVSENPMMFYHQNYDALGADIAFVLNDMENDIYFKIPISDTSVPKFEGPCLCMCILCHSDSRSSEAISVPPKLSPFLWYRMQFCQELLSSVIYEDEQNISLPTFFISFRALFGIDVSDRWFALVGPNKTTVYAWSTIQNELVPSKKLMYVLHMYVGNYLWKRNPENALQLQYEKQTCLYTLKKMCHRRLVLRDAAHVHDINKACAKNNSRAIFESRNGVRHNGGATGDEDFRFQVPTSSGNAIDVDFYHSDRSEDNY